MHGKELYKVYGALLFTLLLVTVLRLLEDAVLAPESLKENVYVAESDASDAEMSEDAGEAPDTAAPDTADGGGTTAKPPGDPVAALLATADAGAGKKLTKKCAACHSFGQGGKNKIGPALWNTVGAKKGGREGFSYSKGLAEKGGTWTYGDLDAFLTAPKAFVPGTKMLFAGLKKPQDRANLILYLRSLSDQPKPLP